MSPPQRRNSRERDVERGASAAAAVSAKSHSVVAAAIGGGGGGSSGLGWDFGSSGDLGMLSVPTSPTAQSPVLPQQSIRLVKPDNG